MQEKLQIVVAIISILIIVIVDLCIARHKWHEDKMLNDMIMLGTMFTVSVVVLVIARIILKI